MNDEFLNEMAEILEEESVAPDDLLDTFSSWDSLAVLSVVAMADAKFGINLTSREVNSASTIQSLYELIVNKKAT